MSISINAVLRKRNDAINTSPCEVEKIIELPMDEFASFWQDLLEPRPFITENTVHMKADQGVHHCLLVLGEGCDDGILINSNGYNFAQYSAFIPFARQSVNAQSQYQRLKDLEKQLSGVVDEIIVKGNASKDAELQYLHNENEAIPILLSVKKQLDDIFHSLNVMTEQFIKKGLIINNGDSLDDHEDEDYDMDGDEDEDQGMDIK